MTTDNNGQPPIAIHYRHNIFKAARQLLGILDGISADGQIDAHEAVFLDIWLRDQQFLRHVPDAIDLLDATGDLLKRDIITATQLSDLKQLVADVLRYNPIAKYGVHHIRDAINTLLGMCHGIVANRRLHNLELRSLHDWLTTTLGGNVAETWPGNIIAKRIEAILADEVITEEERVDLLTTLDLLIGDTVATGAVGFATRLPITSVDIVEFPERMFCLTGRFIFGPRTRCHKAILSKGAFISDTITQSLDYLVIGTLASRDWAHGSFGRKIEQAMDLRDGGAKIAIIAEEDITPYLGFA